MLTGKELGAAIREAMKKKGVVQRQVATEFGIKQPSVSEWLRFGRVSKEHITHLVAYFSTHVGPEHWGLPKHWTTTDLPDQRAPDVVEPEIDISDPIRAVTKLMPFLTPADQQLVLQRVVALMPTHVAPPSTAPIDERD